jgi:hypothetical protein
MIPNDVDALNNIGNALESENGIWKIKDMDEVIYGSGQTSSDPSLDPKIVYCTSCLKLFSLLQILKKEKNIPILT